MARHGSGRSNRRQKMFYDWCSKNQFEVSVLVNNAGYGLSGSFENYSADGTC